MEPLLVYITASSMSEARHIGRALVEARLAACVNIIDGMVSLYHWQGRIEEGSEVVVIAKTKQSLLESLTVKVKAMHSYDCPCIVAMPLAGGNADFLYWIVAETA